MARVPGTSGRSPSHRMRQNASQMESSTLTPRARGQCSPRPTPLVRHRCVQDPSSSDKLPVRQTRAPCPRKSRAAICPSRHSGSLVGGAGTVLTVERSGPRPLTAHFQRIRLVAPSAVNPVVGTNSTSPHLGRWGLAVSAMRGLVRLRKTRPRLSRDRGAGACRAWRRCIRRLRR